MIPSSASSASLWPLDDLTLPGNVLIIIDIETNVIRNLLITQSYHELAQAMAQHLDFDNVHWCAFATWASKQAGAFIRNEDRLNAFLSSKTLMPCYTKMWTSITSYLGFIEGQYYATTK